MLFAILKQICKKMTYNLEKSEVCMANMIKCNFSVDPSVILFRAFPPKMFGRGINIIK